MSCILYLLCDTKSMDASWTSHKYAGKFIVQISRELVIAVGGCGVSAGAPVESWMFPSLEMKILSILGR